MQLTGAARPGRLPRTGVHREGLSGGPPAMSQVLLAQHTFSGVQFPTRHSRDLSDLGLV